MWVEPILFVLIIVGGTAGELCIARAMRVVGEVKDFRPLAIVRVILRALQVGWMWLGVALMATAFFALLGELSIENVSFVVPVTALNYVVGALGGKLFLGERVSRERWAGVALVCVGVMLVLFGKSGR
jgi:drug/metabolite transporter (DMT)-like permease